MAIYELGKDAITALNDVELADMAIKEREDLQRLLRSNISVIAPGTLVIAEEFCEWEDSKRRIDLLAIDEDANLVVIELKRTADGGHMDLQAIRYAAMVSMMTFDRAVQVYEVFLAKTQSDLNARESLLKFLNWTQPDEDKFAQQVRIVLASADFSTELTTSVLWLTDQGIDIRCVRLKPYEFSGRILLDVQQILPLPEARDYQIKFREKQKEKAASGEPASLTRLTLKCEGHTHHDLSARAAILLAVRSLAKTVSPEEIVTAGKFRPFRFKSADGTLDQEQFIAAMKEESAGFDEIRYFCRNEHLIHSAGRAYAFSNQWTGENVISKLKLLSQAFPSFSIECSANGGPYNLLTDT